MTCAASCACLTAICLLIAGADAAETAGGRVQQNKEALAPLQVYVGGWRGVGQLRRGSNRGAWSEAADWAWKFDGGRASLVFETPKGKYYASGRLLPGDKPGEFRLRARRAGGEQEDRFTGRMDPRRQLVLVAEAPAEDQPNRISIRTVAGGDRLIVLYEKRLAGADRYARLAEVGYTRKGSSFAKGSSQPECVVTGGLGTIKVEYQGKTYLVCCTGCRDLFNDDPEGVLAEYRDRKAKEKAESKQKD